MKVKNENFRYLTDDDVSRLTSVPSFVAAKGFVRAVAFGIDWDADGGDSDCPLWSIWFELAFVGENGDVTPLGFVADDERCRDKAVMPVGCEVLPRVAIDGVDGDATRNDSFRFPINTAKNKQSLFIHQKNSCTTIVCCCLRYFIHSLNTPSIQMWVTQRIRQQHCQGYQNIMKNIWRFASYCVVRLTSTLAWFMFCFSHTDEFVAVLVQRKPHVQGITLHSWPELNYFGTSDWWCRSQSENKSSLGIFRYIHGECKLSLGVDGDITDTAKFPVPKPFDAIVFDDWGIISIS